MLETHWALVAALLVHSSQDRAQSSPTASPAAVTQTNTWTDDRPFTRFFQNLGKDFVHLATPNVGQVIGAGTAATILAHQADDRLASWALRSGESSYTVAGRVFGDGWIQSGGAVATYAIGKLTHRPQIIHVGSDLIRAQALNAILTTTIKAGVDRERPYGGRHGMPSGHTSATFASASVLHRHYGWKVGIPAYAVAGFVGWTRVRDRVHWLSDVAFGAAIGTVAGRAVVGSHPGRSLTMTATPTKGGFAVTFFMNKG